MTMRLPNTPVEFRSTPGTLRTETKTEAANHSLQTERPAENWFSRACKVLFPTKAGLALSLVADVGESTCYRYANGERQPPLNFFQILAHDEHQGRTWLFAFMDGCKASWWQDMKDAMEIQDAVLRVQASQRERAGQK